MANSATMSVSPENGGRMSSVSVADEGELAQPSATSTASTARCSGHSRPMRRTRKLLTCAIRCRAVRQVGVGDDEARQDEEEIDEDVGVAQQRAGIDVRGDGQVEQRHQQRTEAAQAIEGGIAAGRGGAIVGHSPRLARAASRPRRRLSAWLPAEPEGFRQQPVGAEAQLMAPHGGRHHHFIGPGGLGLPQDLGPDAVGRTDDPEFCLLVDDRLLRRAVLMRRGLFRRHQLAQLAGMEQRPAQRLRAGEEAGFLVGRGEQRRHREDGMRPGELRARTERRAIGLEGRCRRAWR